MSADASGRRGPAGAGRTVPSPADRLPPLHTGRRGGPGPMQAARSTGVDTGDGPTGRGAAYPDARDGGWADKWSAGAAASPSAAGEREIQREDFTGEALAALRHEFEVSGGLEERRFVDKLHAVLGGHIAQHELLKLFMVRANGLASRAVRGPAPTPGLAQKIDANSDGAVTWDEFAGYMFMAAREVSGDAAGEAESQHYVFQPLRTRPARAGAAHRGQGERPRAAAGAGGHFHRDPITFVGHVPRIDSYVTASQDGAHGACAPLRVEARPTLLQGEASGGPSPLLHPPLPSGSVLLWNAATCTYSSTVATGNDWISGCSLFPHSTCLAAACQDHVVDFYDLAAAAASADHSDLRVPPVGRISGSYLHNASPRCIGTHRDAGSHQDLALIGLDTGAVNVWWLDQGAWCDPPGAAAPAPPLRRLIPCSASLPRHVCDGSLRCHAVPTRERASFETYDAHSGWVTQVDYVPEVESMVSSSSDSTVRVVDLERELCKYTFRGHERVRSHRPRRQVCACGSRPPPAAGRVWLCVVAGESCHGQLWHGAHCHAVEPVLGRLCGAADRALG